MSGHCTIPKFRAEADITYLDHGVCERHWNQLTADDASPDALRMALRMPATPDAAMEEAMDDGQKTSKTEGAETAPARKTRTPKNATPAKAPKVKREKIPAEDVCVFAFRLSTKERTRIHDAAGGGKASQFVLAAALAAADGDVDGFRKVISTRATK